VRTDILGLYSIIAAFSLINPAVAAGTGGCSATNTILGPIADAMIGVFNSASQVGSTGEIGKYLPGVCHQGLSLPCLIGTIIYGLFDNQGRGADWQTFTPLGLVLAGVLTRISIKVVMVFKP